MSKTPKGMPDLPPDFPAFVAIPESNEPQAVVREVDGQLVLDDPAAVGVMLAVGKHNCKNILKLNADRVAHFKRRIAERGDSTEDVLIVIINVDDVHGRDLAETLMPGQDAMWQAMRDQGQVPYARGLAGRQGIQKCLDVVDKEAAEKLISLTGVAVVVVDYGTFEVFEA